MNNWEIFERLYAICLLNSSQNVCITYNLPSMDHINHESSHHFPLSTFFEGAEWKKGFFGIEGVSTRKDRAMKGRIMKDRKVSKFNKDGIVTWFCFGLKKLKISLHVYCDTVPRVLKMQERSEATCHYLTSGRLEGRAIQPVNLVSNFINNEIIIFE